MVDRNNGKNLNVGGMQDQSIFAPALVGATEKAPHAYRSI